MKSFKLMLPMLAFVLAIGAAFAFTSSTEVDFYANGYIQIDGMWHQVEVDCEQQAAFDCVVQIEGEPEETYQVYAEENTSTPLKGTAPVPKVISDPR